MKRHMKRAYAICLALILACTALVAFLPVSTKASFVIEDMESSGTFAELSEAAHVIQVALTSAVDGVGIVAFFNPETGRISMYTRGGISKGHRYVESEDDFWSLVETNREVTRHMHEAISIGDENADWVNRNNRNITVIDFETKMRVEYDGYGNRTEVFLGDEIYDFISFDIPSEEPDKELISPFFDTHERNTFVPFAASPQTGTLVGGNFFTPNSSHLYIGLWVLFLPFGMNSVDVYFTNALGDDRIIFANVPALTLVRHRFRFRNETYGARVSSRSSSGTATLRFLSGNSVNIHLNGNGGFVNPTQLARFSGVPIGGLPTPTRSGRSFVGWFNTSWPTGGTRFTLFTSTPHTSTNLFARWNDPSRHLDRWWPAANVGTTTISYRLVGVTGRWTTPVSNGFRNWNNLTHSTRVSFQTNSSSNNEVRVANRANVPANWLGTHWAYLCLQNPSHIRRSVIYLHPTAIDNFVADPSFNINFNNIVTLAMAHELGHAIGLADVSVSGGNSGSIMDANFFGINDSNIRLSPSNFDITSVNMLYN